MGALKKTSASLAAFALTVSAFAGPDLDTRVQELEKKVDMMSTKTVMGTYGPKTALARPEPNGQGWFLTFDALYWHAKVGGTEYVYTSAYRPNSNFPRADGTLKEIEFDWDWGLKVGLGYNFYHDGWDGYVQYTYFDSDGQAKSFASGASALVPNRGNNAISESANVYSSQGGNSFDSAFNFITRATSDYNFDFDSIELELGRSYFVSRSLSFRPQIGLKSLWLDIKQQTRFSGGPTIAEGGEGEVYGLGANTAYINDKNKLWGLGPRTGFNSKWYLTNGFSIFGNAAGSLLYGYFETQTKNWYSIDTQDHEIRLKSKMHRFVPVAELQLGLSYDQYVYNDKQHISVSLGYEVQYMWRANQSIKPDYPLYNTMSSVDPNMAYTRYSEDASVYGINLQVGWTF